MRTQVISASLSADISEGGSSSRTSLKLSKSSAEEAVEDQSQVMKNHHSRKHRLEKLDDEKYDELTSFEDFDTVEHDFADTHFKLSHNKTNLKSSTT